MQPVAQPRVREEEVDVGFALEHLARPRTRRGPHGAHRYRPVLTTPREPRGLTRAWAMLCSFSSFTQPFGASAAPSSSLPGGPKTCRKARPAMTGASESWRECLPQRLSSTDPWCLTPRKFATVSALRFLVFDGAELIDRCACKRGAQFGPPARCRLCAICGSRYRWECDEDMR